MAKLRPTKLMKCKLSSKRTKVEKRIDKLVHHAEKKAMRRTKREMKQHLLDTSSTSSSHQHPLREKLIVEAERLTTEIRQHKERLHTMQRNLKLIKKELKRGGQLEEDRNTDSPSTSSTNVDSNGYEALKKKCLKRHKKQQKRIALQVDNLVMTLSDTILE